MKLLYTIKHESSFKHKTTVLKWRVIPIFADNTRANPGLILGCCKILQKKIYYNNMRQFKGIITVDYFERSCIETGISWHWMGNQTKWQWALFKNLLSFFLYSLLHNIVKTFIKSFIRFAFVHYKHHTFSGHLEDIYLLFK